MLAAYNYSYANLPTLVEECHKMATVYYFNVAESAHLKNDLQTAHNYYRAIILMSEAMALSTEEVSEGTKTDLSDPRAKFR